MNEEMLKGIKFDEKGLVPVVVQDVDTHVVLMLASVSYTHLDVYKRQEVRSAATPPSSAAIFAATASLVGFCSRV